MTKIQSSLKSQASANDAGNKTSDLRVGGSNPSGRANYPHSFRKLAFPLKINQSPKSAKSPPRSATIGGPCHRLSHPYFLSPGTVNH